MNNYFSLTIEEQRQVLQAAEGRIGLPAVIILLSLLSYRYFEKPINKKIKLLLNK